MQDPVYPPLARRNPDTVFLFALCLLAGIGQVGANTPPGSVEALVPKWLVVGWGVLLIVGAILVLTGVLWHTDNGLLIELIGRVTFGPAALAYAVALIAASKDGNAALATAPFIGFAAACLVRAWQIVHRLERTLAIMERKNRG